MANPIQTVEADLEAVLKKLTKFFGPGGIGAVVIADVEAAAADIPQLLNTFESIISGAGAAGVENLTQEIIADISAIKPTSTQLVRIFNIVAAIEPTFAQLIADALGAAGYIAV